MKWYLVVEQQYSENTPEYGHGDWPAHIPYLAGCVEADTERKAQNLFKKEFPRLRFNGRFAPRLITNPLKQKADARLSSQAQSQHNAIIKLL